MLVFSIVEAVLISMKLTRYGKADRKKPFGQNYSTDFLYCEGDLPVACLKNRVK